MKIGELATAADVTRDTIRHYVSLGLINSGRDNENGYQIFDNQALSRLRFIKTARQIGFQLGEIREIFDDANHSTSPCPRVRELMVQHIAATRKTISELTELCNRMELALDDWQHMHDGVPDGHTVCRLIESQMDVR